MQDVIAKDNGIIRDNGNVEFIDNTDIAAVQQQDEPQEEIKTVFMDEL